MTPLALILALAPLSPPAVVVVAPEATALVFVKRGKATVFRWDDLDGGGDRHACGPGRLSDVADADPMYLAHRSLPCGTVVVVCTGAEPVRHRCALATVRDAGPWGMCCPQETALAAGPILAENTNDNATLPASMALADARCRGEDRPVYHVATRVPGTTRIVYPEGCVYRGVADLSRELGARVGLRGSGRHRFGRVTIYAVETP